MKDSLQISLTILLADFNETIPDLVPYNSTVNCNTSLWKVLILRAKMNLPAGTLKALLL